MGHDTLQAQDDGQVRSLTAINAQTRSTWVTSVAVSYMLVLQCACFCVAADSFQDVSPHEREGGLRMWLCVCACECTLVL